MMPLSFSVRCKIHGFSAPFNFRSKSFFRFSFFLNPFTRFVRLERDVESTLSILPVADFAAVIASFEC